MAKAQVEDFEVEEEEVEAPEEMADRVLDEMSFEEVDDTEFDDGDEGEPDVDSLKAEVEQLKGQLASAQSNTEIKEGFKELGGVLKQLASQKTGDKATDQQNKQQLEDYETFKKKLADGYYDSPVDAVEKFYQRKLQEEIAPAFQQVLGEVQRLKASVGKQTAKGDDVGRLVVENYGDEVDKLVTSGRVNYEDAVQQVAGKHMTDLIRMATEEALSSKKEATVGKNQNPTNRRPQPSSTGKVRIKSSDMQAIRDEAQRVSLDVEQYVTYLKKKGDPRVSGKRR